MPGPTGGQTAATAERLIRRYYRAIDANDLETVYGLFDPEIVYQRGAVTIRGMAAFRRFYEHQRGVTSGRHRLLTVVVDNDWVAVRGRFAARLAGGEDARIEFTDFHHLRAGRINRRYTHFAGRSI
jgi:ketosteroid isomerase-like protein